MKPPRRRTRPVLVRVGVALAIVAVGFVLLQAGARAVEARATVALLRALGSDRVFVGGGPDIVITPATHDAFIAVITPSCSALASVLALSCLGLLSGSAPWPRRAGALAAALLLVVVGNLLRIAGSAAAGLVMGSASLVLFHDWVGSVFGVAYTMFGYLLMLYLLLPKRQGLAEAPAVAAPARGGA